MRTNSMAFLFGAMLLHFVLSETIANAEERPPNVVFILADDLGYRELGSFGQKLIKTPNIDKLARQGMRLTQHYCGNAVCAPSRCVLLTGKHPGHAIVRDNRSTPPEGQWPIPNSEVTIAEAFQSAGYVTGAFGKWGLGGPDSSGRPLNQGVDRFFGYNCQAHAHSYYPSYLWDNEKHFVMQNDPEVPGHASLAEGADASDPKFYDVFKGQDYAPDRIHAAALDFVKENKDKPFFLYYPSVIPHVALHVPDEDLKPYLDLGWEDPPFTRGKGYGYTPHFTPRAAYAAMITRLDLYVGRLMELLDELGLADNTIVVFSSDNGTTHLGEEVDYNFFASVGELRGLKGSLYEGGVRVPTIVRWPGKVPAGAESDRISGFEDWMPTLLDMTDNVEAFPAGIDGISMKKTLLGQKQVERPYLYREFAGYGGQQSIRVGDWKAVRQKMKSGNLDIELYNIAEDLSEANNVAADHPDVVQHLETMMKEARTPSELFPMVPIDAPVGKKNVAPLKQAFLNGDGPGWRSLGKNDFTNVNCDEDTWRWERGVAYCTGNPVGVIRSKKILSNFEMVCEWKHKKKGGNSGVFLWASQESIDNLAAGKGRLPNGIEVQVLDLGYAELYLQGGNGRKADWFTSHGDVFPTGPAKMKPFPPVAPNGRRSFPSKNLTNDVNQWNHYYIRAINGEVRLWVNGEEVSGGTECEPAEGYLCLESEGAPVEFRNLRIRELP
ncbi:MAG: sulfatase-like hydrolase/transferase [Planctomycetota bacterium]